MIYSKPPSEVIYWENERRRETKKTVYLINVMMYVGTINQLSVNWNYLFHNDFYQLSDYPNNMTGNQALYFPFRIEELIIFQHLKHQYYVFLGFRFFYFLCRLGWMINRRFYWQKIESTTEHTLRKSLCLSSFVLSFLLSMQLSLMRSAISLSWTLR